MKHNMKKALLWGTAFSMLFSTIAPTVPAFASTPAAVSVQTTDFSVGKGIEWPVRMNAPYADMCEWITTPGYNIGGSLDLAAISKDTGISYFNMAFIQSAGPVANGKLGWGWGGYSILSEGKGNADEQYLGIKKSISNIRSMGGDVCISFGGASGTAFWQSTQDVDVLYNTYLEIVNGYGLTRIDLDVEGGAQNKTQNEANAKAIKKLQSTTGVSVVLTLPVLPDGLTSEGLAVLNAYLAEGVNLTAVNIMTMCYGTGVLKPGENYGTASLRAVDSLKSQLISNYAKYGTTLTDAQAYGKIGTTVSIGYESSAHPIFTTQWSELVVNHAIQNNLGMTSFWSVNRDAMTESNQGVKQKYEFTDVFKNFGSGGTVTPPDVDQKPVISGAANKEVTVGDTFDVMAGITASDKEDGDLTSAVQVAGSVDTKKAGTYQLTYSVKDSKGQSVSVSCIITVKEKGTVTPPAGNTYDSSKVYVGGETVIYEGNTYRCKWWTQGEAPGSQYGPWELVS